MESSSDIRELVGLIPAAGQASRLAPLPCSKELLPVEQGASAQGRRGGPKVACEYLLEGIQAAGAERAYIILRKGKWDIPIYLGDGYAFDLSLGYLVMRLPHGVPYTLDQAYPFVQEAHVLFGFPDILFRPKDAFMRLLSKQQTTGADVVLGLHPARNPHKADMVDFDAEGRVRSIDIKPAETTRTLAWTMAVWTPSFSRFMHRRVTTHHEQNAPPRADGREELFVGHIFQNAIEEGLTVHALPFSGHSYIDIGTPEEFARATRGDW